MRHLKAYRKLNRTSSHRSLMLRNLVTSLFEHERVETTLMKAKEARRIAEKMITLGKRGTLHARRQAASVLMSKAVVKKLFEEIAPKYANRNGGYTRILRVGYRKGDGAPLAFLELVEEEVAVKKKSKKKTSAKAAPKKAKEKAKVKEEAKKAAPPVEEKAEAAEEAVEEKAEEKVEAAPEEVKDEAAEGEEESKEPEEKPEEKAEEK